ncbi:MAG TPA: 23S rRNA (uracil(1939)-C(5))-methyltransferase RlmD [Candidatus Merdenecus merdavium]|nr:23S rRNA (uracil(1939)-C(5))-methyltransferase RlmD [Candidatus Merdenecus merdavium]
MKKGQVLEGVIEKVKFPNKGIVNIDGEKIIVKNGVPGQKVRFSINKKKKDRYEGRLIEVLETSPIEIEATCPHFGVCGGCLYQNLSYEDQLKLKESQVKELLDSVCSHYVYEGILGSPISCSYRNKMEFSFGDEVKDGPLALGMHKRGSFHDIVTVDQCKIVDHDYNLILDCVLNYFKSRNVSFYHKMRHEGYLRHLLVRKGFKTKEILIDLVTSSQEEMDLTDFVQELLNLPLENKIVGILHTLNDSLADVVKNDGTTILYGQDYFYEELLGLQFKISPFSFFQTNSLGAEVLYSAAREYIGETKDKIIFDLYSGTGTIAQILAPVAKRVIGVEIVEEAVEAAKENAKLNKLDNCEFIAGDVLKVIHEIQEKPDLIVLDPPRDGIHPKALKKIIEFNVDRIVYISCKPTSLVRDLQVLQENGYKVVKGQAIDMFPGTYHVETVVLMSRVEKQECNKISK